MNYIDSSVLVAAALEDHEHFEASNAFLEMQSDATCMTAAHALVETYSVLTRIPKPMRLSPGEAIRIIENWREALRLVALDPEAILQALRDSATTGVAGGRIYDAVHARTAVTAGASLIVTWNEKHFIGLEPDIKVTTP